MIEELNRYVFEQHPALSAKVARLENGPPVGYPIVVRISGVDADELLSRAAEVTDYLYGLPDVAAVSSTWGLQTKKIIVSVDQERARRSGVTSDDVAYSSGRACRASP